VYGGVEQVMTRVHKIAIFEKERKKCRMGVVVIKVMLR
jgi:hypothetical protein